MSENMRLQVDVEPLSEARVAKVRQQVLTGAARERVTPALQPSRWPSRWNAAAMVSFVAAAVIAGLVTRAWVVRAGGPGEDARLVTNESASQLTVGESSLDIAPQSTVVVHGDDARGIDVVLDRGAVTCEVAPRRGRPPFVVDAGEVRVRVVGTRFTVARDGAGVHVRVDHGAVEVASHGVVTMLHDGEAWPSAAAVAPADARSPVPSASPEPASAPPDDAVVTPPARGARPPRHAVRAWRAPRAKTRSAIPYADFPEDDAPAMTPSAPPAPSAPLPSTPSAPTAPSAREQFETAARLEPSEPARAAALYRQLARGGTAWAPNALYALARLEADRGNTSDAQRLLRDYLARYPHGQNAPDARKLLVPSPSSP